MVSVYKMCPDEAADSAEVRWGGGRCWSSGGGDILCMRDILILNEIWKQGKIYFLVGTLPG
jgi:hypothetical protein